MKAKAQARRLELMPLAAITGADKNPKQHAHEDIGKSIGRFGYVEPVVLDERTNRLVAGHGRVQALRAAKVKGEAPPQGVEVNDKGEWLVPVLRGWESRSDAEASAYLVASNSLTAKGGWDNAGLAELLQSLDAQHALEGTGYDAAAIGEVLAQASKESKGTEGLTDPDDVPETAEPKTKLGDVWVLGRHRIMCGDSTSPVDMEKLMGGQKADICFTSPPYGLGENSKLSGNTSVSARASRHVEHGIKAASLYEDHDDDPAKWADLMRGWIAAASQVVEHGFVVNVQMLASNKRNLVKWMADNAYRLCDVAVWRKPHGPPNMASGVMTSDFEWLIVLAGKNASRRVPCSSWHGTVAAVYEGPPQKKNEFASVHAATMPVHLPLWVLGTLCNESKSVLDPFGGTGTTTIAAEQLGRACFSMELSPRYVDISIARWEAFTGQKAVKA